MDVLTILTLIFIAAGALIMAVNISRARRTLRLLRGVAAQEGRDVNAAFRVHEILMGFFLLGYSAVAYAIVADVHLFSELFVGIIFFFGAVFVLLGIRMQTMMISAIKNRYEQESAANEALRRERSNLEQANEGLARAIARRDAAEQEKSNLEQRLARAQRMEALGLLAGGVAHDLNNVLTGAVTYPDLIMMELSEDNPLREQIRTIQQSGKKAAAIVQDLLTLARRNVSSTRVINLNAVIEQYLASPEHQKVLHFHRNVECAVDLEPELMNIIGSGVHLAKTVMNLVSNAAEALSEGGQIMISTENFHLEGPATGTEEVQPGDYAVLRVEDDGEGISPGDIDRIFEPFYSKKVMGRSGTGLGMSVVWGTVQDHRGHIFVESALGVGTAFRLLFPATRKALPQSPSEHPIEDLMGHGETILVVDDVAQQRDVAERILSKLNYRVQTAARGEQAVARWAQEPADLLILDMIMDPGIDGLETYRRILELSPGQKAIIISGFSETSRVKEAMRLGAGQYIRKPYTLESIGLAVKKELRRGAQGPSRSCSRRLDRPARGR